MNKDASIYRIENLFSSRRFVIPSESEESAVFCNEQSAATIVTPSESKTSRIMQAADNNPRSAA